MRVAWSLRNDQSNCVLIAPRSTDQLYLHLNALKILTKMNPSVMEDVETILNNKPAVKRRGQSVSERSAILAAAAATSPSATAAAAGTSTAESSAAAAAAAAASSSVPSGPVQV